MILEYRLYIFGAFFVIIFFEALWSYRKKQKAYNKQEVRANLTILLINQLTKPFYFAWVMVALEWIYQFRVFNLPDTMMTTIVAVIFVDFLFYWQHRFKHEVKALWSIHNTHHSSPWFNLTTAFRINWIAGFTAPFYYIPAILLGFSPTHIFLFLALNLAYQFFLHTEAIGKIPLIEGIFNTPSAHRVHHGSNKKYIDKNYGGVLMIWDRLFGTYQKEEEKVVYGVTTGFEGHNAIKLNFKPIRNYLSGELKREKHIAAEFNHQDNN